MCHASRRSRNLGSISRRFAQKCARPRLRFYETVRKVVGVGDAFDERGQGEGVGEEGSLGALFGRAFRSAHAVCGLSGGFAEPGVLNASEVLPGCKNARAAARALGLAPPTTRGCSRVHNTPKGVLNVSERAFELCMASSTRECEVE